MVVTVGDSVAARGKFEEFKNQWKNGAPSKYYQSPMPHESLDAIASANFLKNKGQYVGVDPDGGLHPLKDRDAFIKFYNTVEQFKASQGGK